MYVHIKFDITYVYINYYIHIKIDISFRRRSVLNLHLLLTQIRTDSDVRPIGTVQISDALGQTHHTHVD